MAVLIHSKGPWKEHKYIKKTGEGETARYYYKLPTSRKKNITGTAKEGSIYKRGGPIVYAGNNVQSSIASLYLYLIRDPENTINWEQLSGFDITTWKECENISEGTKVGSFNTKQGYWVYNKELGIPFIMPNPKYYDRLMNTNSGYYDMSILDEVDREKTKFHDKLVETAKICIKENRSKDRADAMMRKSYAQGLEHLFNKVGPAYLLDLSKNSNPPDVSHLVDAVPTKPLSGNSTPTIVDIPMLSDPIPAELFR